MGGKPPPLGHAVGIWKLGSVDGIGGNASDGSGGALELGLALGEPLLEGRGGTCGPCACGGFPGVLRVGTSGGVLVSAVGCVVSVPGAGGMGAGNVGTTTVGEDGPVPNTTAPAIPAPSTSDPTTRPMTSP